MSRGNINYKYLRRRKSWFRRNLTLIIIIAVVTIVICFGGFFAVKSILNISGKKNSTNSDSGNDATEQTTVAREINWIENTEPADNEVTYTPPEGVSFPYFIKVNRAANCVTVYGIDEKGEYSIPVKAFAASCGKAGDETIIGENYTTSDKYEWRQMVDGTYAQYAFRISGGYLFHSIPYYSTDKSRLEDGQFNKIGDFASLGCVRLCVRDVKWIYDNCPAGTNVTIYDDERNPGPLGMPETIKIPDGSPNAGWDPTDPDDKNPWKTCSAAITGASDIETEVGQQVDVLKNIKATDICGNDITDKVIVVGRYTFDQAGEYNIKYEVTDAIGSKAEVTVKLTVK